MTEKEILSLRNELFSMRDDKYKAFQEKLMPSVDTDSVIGIRTPALRRFAAEFAKKQSSSNFLKTLPHTYYEENNLHAFLIEKIGDFDRTVEELNRFLPYVDNWATCDMMSPKVFSANQEKLLPIIKEWLSSPHIYMARFGIVTLMKHYLDEDFSPHHLQMVADVPSDEYYIEMAKAWYFAEALVKQYDSALPYLTSSRLSPSVHNKTISKACDSFRVSKDKKDFLKILRKKNSK